MFNPSSSPAIRLDGDFARLPFRFARGALGFWVASLVGFAAYGYLVAELAQAGMGDGSRAEAAETALALGGAGAVALGVPAALLFGAVMRRVRRGAEWPVALATGLVLSGAVYLPLRLFASVVAADWGPARGPAAFCVASAGAMMAGAIAGTLAARPGPKLALARSARVEAPADAAHARLI
jgi:hypothetical protein